MHNMYNAYRAMYEALGVKNIDMILKPVARPVPMDPSVEAIQALAGKPFQAFKGQDHRAHITAHLNFMATNIARNAPPVMAALEKNIFEHINLMSDEQVQLEFVEELQELQMIQQQMGAVNPAMMAGMMQNPQVMQMQQRVQQITNQIESRKAILIAEMQEDFAKEEEKIMGEFGGDPLLRLKGRELDLRAQENQRKKAEGQERLDLDKMKKKN